MTPTVSLQTAKLLKDEGFPQGSECMWAEFYNTSSNCPNVLLSSLLGVEELEDFKERNYLKDLKFYSAPTTDELLAELPVSIGDKNWFQITRSFNGYKEVVQSVAYVYWLPENTIGQIFLKDVHKITNDSLPEALAQMWLYLKKEGLLNDTRTN